MPSTTIRQPATVHAAMISLEFDSCDAGFAAQCNFNVILAEPVLIKVVGVFY